MKILRSLSSLVTLLVFAAVAAPTAEEVEKLRRESTDAIESLKKSDSTLSPHFEKAAGYAVFPHVGKGGLVFGGAHGRGLVFEAGQVVGKASMSQATFGAQIGGQVFREIIFLETQESLAAFKKGGFEMTAQVGAVAAAEGAGQNARYRDGVLVFTQPVKGLMAEASVGGQKFKFEPLP